MCWWCSSLFHDASVAAGAVQYQLVHEIMKHILSTFLFPILHWGSSPVYISSAAAGCVSSELPDFSLLSCFSSTLFSRLWSPPIIIDIHPLSCAPAWPTPGQVFESHWDTRTSTRLQAIFDSPMPQPNPTATSHCCGVTQVELMKCQQTGRHAEGAMWLAQSDNPGAAWGQRRRTAGACSCYAGIKRAHVIPCARTYNQLRWRDGKQPDRQADMRLTGTLCKQEKWRRVWFGGVSSNFLSVRVPFTWCGNIFRYMAKDSSKLWMIFYIVKKKD